MDTQANPDAVRARRYRQRRRNGLKVSTVVWDEIKFPKALVAMRLLKPEHIDNGPAIEHSLQKLVDTVSEDE
jgi:hypothetical protein